MDDLSKEELNEIFNSAWDLRIEGNNKEAKRLFEEIIKNGNPKYFYEYFDSFNGLGNIYFDQNDLDKAEECYKVVFQNIQKHFGKDWKNKKIEWEEINNRPFLRGAHGLGLVYWRKKKFKDALEIFQALLKISPNDNLGVRFIINDIKNHQEWTTGSEDF
jgi:tetratricopeptide (TPR) repeat protein